LLLTSSLKFVGMLNLKLTLLTVHFHISSKLLLYHCQYSTPRLLTPTAVYH